MTKGYVLDTSAILTFAKGEAGCDTVEDILLGAGKGKHHTYISFITLMELYYVTWQAQSEAAAKEMVILVKALPVQKIDSNERISLAAGRIKANYRLSVADAFIAATAMDKGATLVHKDPELVPLSEHIDILQLPFKPGRSR